MRRIKYFALATTLGVLLTGFAHAQADRQTSGRVCGDPAALCGKSFEANDISFVMPAKLKWLKHYYSAYFYAVILKSRRAIKDEDLGEPSKCSQGYFSEAERKQTQSTFRGNKVFASRNGCYIPGVAYTNVDSKYEFLAVYGGRSEDEAKTFLRTVKAKGYADATIRRMRVVFYNGD